MLDHVNPRLNLMKEWMEPPEQLCVGNTKISINIKTNVERKSEIRLDSSFFLKSGKTKEKIGAVLGNE
jgi:hypothetical protein